MSPAAGARTLMCGWRMGALPGLHVVGAVGSHAKVASNRGITEAEGMSAEKAPPGGAVGGRDVLLAAAATCFFEHSYDGTSIREITARAGLTVASIYYYYDSKQALLFDVIERFTKWSLETTRAAVLGAGEDPTARLVAAVRSHVHQHATHVVESYVADNELRSLSAPNLAVVVGLRDQIQATFDSAVLDGCRSGVFETPYPDELSRALVTMCTAVASWYRSDGPLTPDQVADHYVTFALSLANCRTRGTSTH